MKKFVSYLGGLSLAGLIMGGIIAGGCKVTPEQAQVIARNAGLYSAVIWISIDNPDAAQILLVKEVLNIIERDANKIEAGKTYLEVIYPEVVKFIDSNVEPKDRPLCKAAALSLLNGLDMLFVMHPEWKENEQLALQIVVAYIHGAKLGLGLDDDDPVMIQARGTARRRSQALSN